MPTRHVLLVAVLLAVPQAAVPAQGVRVHADLNLRVNAVYHLACLAESIACTREVFDRFWKSRLSWSEVDQSALDTWRRVMAAVAAAAPPRPAAPFLANTPRFHPAQAARTRVIVEVIEAASAGDLQAKSKELLSQEDAAQLHGVVAHFERRLSGWFTTAAGMSAQRRIKLVDDAVKSRTFADSLARMAAFLQSKLPGQDLYVHAIAGPEPSSDESSATQLGGHLLVEVVSGTDNEGIVSGAVHELTHYLYDCAPAERHRALIDQFVQSGSPHAPGLYTYLNEAVAVAAQAMHESPPTFAMINPRTMTVMGFQKRKDDSYRHPYVAPLGAAAVALVREAVARKRTIFDDFAARYIAAGTAALKGRVTEPQFTLAQVGLRLPAGGEAIRTTWLQVMFPHASAVFTGDRAADAFPDLHIVRFVHYDDVPASGLSIPDLAALVRHRAFGYASPRGQRATTYVLAGRDTDAIMDAIRKLASLTALPSKGLVFTVE